MLNGLEGRTCERFLGLPVAVVVTVLWLVGTMLAGTCALVVYLVHHQVTSWGMDR